MFSADLAKAFRFRRGGPQWAPRQSGAVSATASSRRQTHCG